MNIAANVLLVLLIPTTILSNVVLRESQRAQGPDVMGPAFVFVVSCGIRWITALVIISLLVGGGSFDAGIPSRGAQLLLLIAVFAVVDWAAGIADVACAPELVAAGPAVVLIGRVLSFAVPIALLIWLMPMVHGYLSRAATWGFIVPILLAAVLMLPGFYRVYAKTKEQKNATIAAYWENQKKLTEQGVAEIKALAIDCPLEKLTPYLSGDWPSDVRSEVFTRIRNRPDVAGEILTMLADDHRRGGAVEYIRQTSTSELPCLNLKVRDFYLELADRWAARGPNLTDEQLSLLAPDCDGAVTIAYPLETERVRFYAVMERWREIISAAPQTPAILEARKKLDHWFEISPRPASTTSPATER